MKIAFLILPLIALSACGYSAMDAADAVSGSVSGDFADGTAIGTQPAATAAFTKLSLMGPDDVIFTVGDRFEISAAGDAKALQKLRYVIVDGNIKIGREKGNWSGNNEKAVVRVTAPSITAISLAGSGNVKADRVDGDNARFALAGSGNISVDQVRAQTAKVSVAGSGNIDLAGTAKDVKLSVAGSGDVNAGKLSAVDADVSVAGSGNVDLSASGAVKANIVGSGDVNVTGGAKCQTSKMGSGKLHCS